jgi:hypothetical protein
MATNPAAVAVAAEGSDINGKSFVVGTDADSYWRQGGPNTVVAGGWRITFGGKQKEVLQVAFVGADEKKHFISPSLDIHSVPYQG